MKEEYENIRPGLYEDVMGLNADAPKDRRITGKTLRKIFANWMTLAGMEQDVADAIEARDDHNVSNVSYHSTADMKGKLQYPKCVKLFLLEFPIEDWVKDYRGNVAHTLPRQYSEMDEREILGKLEDGWTNKSLVKAGICSAGKASEIAKKHGLNRNSNRGRRKM